MEFELLKMHISLLEAKLRDTNKQLFLLKLVTGDASTCETEEEQGRSMESNGNKMMNINDMPEDAIIHIFSFLKLKERKNTRLVCKLWYRLSYTLSLVNQDVTTIQSYEDLDTFSADSRHVNLFMDFRFINKSIRNAKFWARHGQHVKSLEIRIILIDRSHIGCYEEMSHIFAMCPNLERLTLIDENLDFPSEKTIQLCCSYKFPKLLKVNLTVPSSLAVPLMQNFKENSPRMESISVHCFNLDDNKAYSDTLFDLINEKANKIKELEFCYCDVLDVIVDSMTKDMGPQFKRLAIIDGNIPNGLSTVAKKVSNIREILLNNCRFAEADFKISMLNLSQLTVISLSQTNINNSGLAALAVLRNLSHLNLSGCYELTDWGISQVFGHYLRPQMIELRLAHLKKITDGIIMEISQYLPNLQIFSLQGCESLTDRSLEAIFTHNQKLRCLSIRDCSQVENINVGLSIDSLMELRHLDVFGTKVEESLLKRVKLRSLEVVDFNDNVIDECEEFPDCPSLYKTNLLFECQIKSLGERHLKTVTSILKCHDSPFGSCYESNKIVIYSEALYDQIESDDSDDSDPFEFNPYDYDSDLYEFNPYDYDSDPNDF